MKKYSKCCKAIILVIPKYQSYDMEDNPTVKICGKCKKRIEF